MTVMMVCGRVGHVGPWRATTGNSPHVQRSPKCLESALGSRCQQANHAFISYLPFPPLCSFLLFFFLFSFFLGISSLSSISLHLEKMSSNYWVRKQAQSSQCCLNWGRGVLRYVVRSDSLFATRCYWETFDVALRIIMCKATTHPRSPRLLTKLTVRTRAVCGSSH